LLAIVATLREEIAALRAENAELRAQLNRNSQNSSKPPSTDLPGSRPPTGRRGKGRKRGGQPGHERRLAAVPEHVDEVKQYRPSMCKQCGASLAKGKPTGSCINHYVYELPPIRPIVTDHQCLDVQCPQCGRVTAAQLPPDVPSGQYGPTVQATVGFLRGELRLAMRSTSEVMSTVLHVPMSTGMVAKTQEQVSRALEAPFQEAFAQARASERAHADETSWREDKKKAWLWVSVTALVTVFLVRATRGAKAAKELLGDTFAGILTTDRWASYRWVAAERRQLCWSHLKRDFTSFLDHGDEAKRLAERLLCAKRKLFRLWHCVRDGTMSRAKLKLVSQPAQRRIVALLEEGTGLSNRKVSGVCREILKLEPALFTFIDADDVEPTNNAAERAIRFAVLMRKGCFGSDSAKGSRFVERFLTVRATLRRQKRDLYRFLKDACIAALQCTQPPSVLPLRVAGQLAAA
jgi:transposase